MVILVELACKFVLVNETVPPFPPFSSLFNVTVVPEPRIYTEMNSYKC